MKLGRKFGDLFILTLLVISVFISPVININASDMNNMTNVDPVVSEKGVDATDYTETEIGDDNSDEEITTDDASEIKTDNSENKAVGENSKGSEDRSTGGNDDLEVKYFATDTANNPVDWYKSGAYFYYRIEIKNISNSDINNIKVADDFVETFGRGNNKTSINDVIVSDADVWNDLSFSTVLPTIKKGATTVIKLYVRGLDTSLTRDMTSTVEVSYGDNSKIDVTDVMHFIRAGALPITSKTAVDENGNEITKTKIGDIITYDLLLDNQSQTLHVYDTTVIDELPDYLTYIPRTTYVDGEPLEEQDAEGNFLSEPNWEDNTFTYLVDDIRNLDSMTISFSVEVTGAESDMSIYNEFSVWQFDKNMRVASSRIKLSEDVKLASYKKVVDDQGREITEATMDDVIYYEIGVANNSEVATARDIVINDNLEEYLEYQAGTTTVNGKEVEDDIWNDSALSYTVDINAGDTVVVKFAVRVTGMENDKISNRAVIGAKDESGEIDDPQSPLAEIDFVENPKLTTNKKALDSQGVGITEATMNDVIYYEVSAKNTASFAGAEGVVVKDTLADYLEYQAGTTTVNDKQVGDDIWNGNSLEYTTNIDAGDMVVVKFAVKVVGMENNKISNEATVGVKNESGEIDEPQSPSVEIDYVEDLALEVSKKVVDAQGTDITEATMNDVIYYEISAKNIANFSNAEEVLIEDTLADYLEYQAGTTTVNDKKIEDDVWNGDSLEYTTSIDAGDMVVVKFAVKVVGMENNKISNEAMVGIKDGSGEIVDPQNPSVEIDYVEDPELETSKKVMDAEGAEITEATVNDVVYYEVSAKNVASFADAEQVVIRDVLADYLEYQAGTTTVNGAEVGDGIWDGNSLEYATNIDAGDTLVIKFAAKVVGMENNKISNEAVVEVTDASGEIVEAHRPTVEIDYVEDLELEANKKVMDADGVEITEATVNDVVYYEVSAKNVASFADAERVIIRDVLADYLEYQAGTTTVNGTEVGDDIWNGNSLEYPTNIDAGETVVIKFAAKVVGMENGKIVNEAAIAVENELGEVTGSQNPSVEIAYVEEYELEADKRVTDANGVEITEATMDDVIYYEVSAKNIASFADAEQVVIEDTLADYLEYQARTTTINDIQVGDSIWDGNSLKYTTNINAGETVTIRFAVRVIGMEDNKIGNEAVVGIKDESGEVVDSQNPSVEIDYVDNFELEASKRALDSEGVEITEATMDDVIYYEISAKNVSNFTTAEVMVKDILEDYLEYQTETTSVNGVAVADAEIWSGGVLTYSAELEPGETVLVKFAAKVQGSSEGKIYNQATVGVAGEDMGQIVDPLEPFVEINYVEKELPLPELEINKEVKDADGNDINEQEVEIGDTLYYEVTVANVGEVADENLIVEDDLQKGLSMVPDTTSINNAKLSDAEAWTGDSLEIRGDRLDAGKRAVVRFAALVNDEAEDYVKNIAYVGGEISRLRAANLKPTPEVENPIKKVSTEEPDGEDDGDTAGNVGGNDVDASDADKGSTQQVGANTSTGMNSSLPSTGVRSIQVLTLMGVVILSVVYGIRRQNKNAK